MATITKSLGTATLFNGTRRPIKLTELDVQRLRKLARWEVLSAEELGRSEPNLGRTEHRKAEAVRRRMRLLSAAGDGRSKPPIERFLGEDLRLRHSITHRGLSIIGAPWSTPTAPTIGRANRAELAHRTAHFLTQTVPGLQHWTRREIYEGVTIEGQPLPFDPRHARIPDLALSRDNGRTVLAFFATPNRIQHASKADHLWSTFEHERAPKAVTSVWLICTSPAQAAALTRATETAPTGSRGLCWLDNNGHLSGAALRAVQALPVAI